METIERLRTKLEEAALRAALDESKEKELKEVSLELLEAYQRQGTDKTVPMGLSEDVHFRRKRVPSDLNRKREQSAA